MTVDRKAQLQSIMNIAWSFRRADPDRTFANCLRGAWKWVKGIAKEAAKFMKRAIKAGGVVRISGSLTRSPIKRSLQGARYGRRKDYQAAYMTARLGY